MKVENEKDLEKALDGFLLDDFEAYGNDAQLFMKLQQKVASQTTSQMIDLSNIIIYSVLPAEFQKKDDTVLTYELPPGDFGKWYYTMCCANNILNGSAAKDEKAREETLKQLPEQLVGAHIASFPYEMFKTTADSKKMINKRLLAELQGTGLLFADVTTDRLYIVSRYALPTLGQRIRASGDFLTTSSFARDVLLAALFKRPKLVKFITRTQDKIAKIFMASTSTYNELPLTVIEKLYFLFAQASGFTGMTCDGWLLNHSISCIRFSFDNETVIQELRETYEEELEAFDCTYGLDVLPKPGIEIKSSDIGDCAFIVRGYWKFPHTVLYTEEVARKHSGKFTADDVVKEVKETVFSRYAELPETLIKLLQIEVTPESIQEAFRKKDQLEDRVRTLTAIIARLNPDTDSEKISAFRTELDERTDLLKAASEEATLAATKHQKLLENFLLTTLHRVKIGTYSMKKTWREKILGKFDPMGIYTAYDVVCAIVDTPFEGSAESEEKTQKALSSLPYLDYESILQKVMQKRRVRIGKGKGRGNSTDVIEPDEMDDTAESDPSELNNVDTDSDDNDH